MQPKKTKKPAPPIPENQDRPLPLKELLKQTTLDRYDVQELFKVSRNTINNWCNKGILSFSKIGRKRFFNAELIKKQLEVHKHVTVSGQGKKGGEKLKDR